MSAPHFQGLDAGESGRGALPPKVGLDTVWKSILDPNDISNGDRIAATPTRFALRIFTRVPGNNHIVWRFAVSLLLAYDSALGNKPRRKHSLSVIGSRWSIGQIKCGRMSRVGEAP